jgi:hypothetical protein
MLPFGVTIPATVPQGSEIPEELMNNPVYSQQIYTTTIKDKHKSTQLKNLFYHILA